jgi:hypothetical protein
MRFCIIVNVIIHVLLQATSSGLIFEKNSKFLLQYCDNITSYILYRMSCIIQILSQSLIHYIRMPIIDEILLKPIPHLFQNKFRYDFVTNSFVLCM